MLRVKDLVFIKERQDKNLDGWQGGYMSLVGRKVLIDASLNSRIVYYMSMFRFHKTFNVKLVKKHMVNWDLISRPIEKGVLGIKYLYKMNKSLLVKWWWKLKVKMVCGRN
jgi:hypothetical protein